MKHLLITGFDPFGGEAVNPAWEAVSRLPDTIGGYRLTKLQIPTIFETAADTVLAAAETDAPDVILCIGQAGGRDAVTPERIAINCMDARIPDNAGNRPVNVPVAEDGPAAYFTTLPVHAMTAAIRDAGIPGALSYSAGVFVCNDLLYTLLHRYHGTAVRVGFIHIPYLPEQAREGVPSLPLGEAVRGLTAAIEVLGGIEL